MLEHPNSDRYIGQRIFVVQREEYVYLMPFVEDEHTAAAPVRQDHEHE